MGTFIGLLRGVNVGGKKKIVMADLQKVLTAIGLAEVRTLLNSGNVVFSAGAGKKPTALEELLEKKVQERLGFTCDFHVRSNVEWRALIEANPLPKSAARDPSHFVVICLKSAPAAAALSALRAANSGDETIEMVGRQLYVDFGATHMAETKLTGAFLDRHLGSRGTGRNWNTVLKLATLAGL